MKIYLDSKDLIDIVEHSKPCSADDFEKTIKSSGYELGISLINIIEISYPLLVKNAQTNIARFWNRVEKMPILYMANIKITELELKEAFKAFNQREEYQQINPFVNKHFDMLIGEAPPVIKYYLNYPLAEIVFDVWRAKPDVFKKKGAYNDELKRRVSSNRTETTTSTVLDKFRFTIKEHLKNKRIKIKSEDLNSFVEWICQTPSRCPSIRLVFESMQTLIRNLADIPKDGDVYDFSHINCIPYVDKATLDNRMYNYCMQACRNLELNYENRVFRSAEDLIKTL